MRRAFTLRGRGLFTARPCAVEVRPAAPGSGWSWQVPRGRRWPVDPDHHRPLDRRSALVAPDGTAVELVEHLLAALVLLDIDDVSLILTGSEVPLLDGSARPWLRAARDAGWWRLPARPSSLRATVHVGEEHLHWAMGELWPGAARTFLPMTLLHGLRPRFPGARSGQALLTDGRLRPVRGPRPRIRREPVAHKLLDLLGDLGPWRALGPLDGHLKAIDPGHGRNGSIIRHALGRPEALGFPSPCPPGTLRLRPRDIP